jgi:hypothetical protein
LSSATISASASFSTAAPPRNRIPCRAPTQSPQPVHLDLSITWSVPSIRSPSPRSSFSIR